MVLCADDFGLTEGVSRGILELAHLGRLSAASVMAHRPWWRRLAPELKAVEDRVAVGLHLTLTLGAPLGPMPCLAPVGNFPNNADVVRRSLTGRLPMHEVAEEVARQLDAFEAAFGRAPDFVDGHQHVHALPGVRRALLDVAKRRGASFWLRDPTDRLGAVLARRVAAPKALMVGALASGFRQAARGAALDTNDGFSGFSSFDETLGAAAPIEAAFSHLGPRPVVMCHPGVVDNELKGLDPVTETRAQEKAYLASDRFADFLERRGIELVMSPLSVTLPRTSAPRAPS